MPCPCCVQKLYNMHSRRSNAERGSRMQHAQMLSAACWRGLSRVRLYPITHHDVYRPALCILLVGRIWALMTHLDGGRIGVLPGALLGVAASRKGAQDLLLQAACSTPSTASHDTIWAVGGSNLPGRPNFPAQALLWQATSETSAL